MMLPARSTTEKTTTTTMFIADVHPGMCYMSIFGMLLLTKKRGFNLKIQHDTKNRECSHQSLSKV